MAQITTYFTSSSGGGISGTGVATRIAYWSGASAITSDSGLFYDPTNNRVSISAGTSPGASLTIKTEDYTDTKSAIQVYTQPSEQVTNVFNVYNNGRIDSQVARSDDGTETGSMAIGFGAGENITLASRCVLLGDSAGKALTDSNNNTAIGVSALERATGSENTSTGTFSLTLCTTGELNTAAGASSLYSLSTGNNNVAVGHYAGSYRTSYGGAEVNPSNSIYIGEGAVSGGASTNVSNEIVIGRRAIGAGSNTTTIGNASCTACIVRGDIYPTGNVVIINRDIVLSTGTGTKIGTSASEKLAFWGDTPVVQPTTSITPATISHIGGTTIGANDTFNGYTLAKVVAALQQIGILA